MVLGLVVGAVIAGSNILGHREKRKAAKKQNQANALQQEIADNQAAAERRRQIREARILRGRVVNQSAATGGMGSSGESSAIGGASSQLGFNLNQSFVTQSLSGATTSALNAASRRNMRASAYGTIGQLAGTFAGLGG